MIVSITTVMDLSSESDWQFAVFIRSAERCGVGSTLRDQREHLISSGTYDFGQLTLTPGSSLEVVPGFGASCGYRGNGECMRGVVVLC